MNTTRQNPTAQEQPYHSYLLRLWRVKTVNGWGWQASLENITTRKVQRFPDLEALYTFLKAETETSQRPL